MADRYDEDAFSDPGFDDLPANTLHQMEDDAVTFSQHATASGTRGGLQNLSGYRDAYSALNQRNGRHEQDKQEEEPGREPPSSDYGFDDEDVIDLDEPSLVIQPASGPVARAARADGDYNEEGQAPWNRQNEQRPYQQVDTAELQRRVAELERERANLQKLVEDTRSDAMSKAGAIAILRNNVDKATKEYERKLAIMQSLHADEAAKQKAEIEAARKERETVQTNNRFLEHDLAQEVERTKRLKGPATIGHNGDRSRQSRTNTTPQKNRNLPFRDGFDDHEIVGISPSKSREHIKGETPKAGGKRKRPVDASPVPLVISQPRDSPLPEPSRVSSPNAYEHVPLNLLEQQDSTVRVFQRILNHAPSAGHDRTIEALVKYALPSAPAVSLSSLLLQELSSFRPKDDGLPITIHTCFACLTLWAKCLAESYFDPLYLLVDLLESVVIAEPWSTQVALIDRYVPLAAGTIDLVAVPKAKLLTKNPALDKAAIARLEERIDVNHILDILHMLAMSASFVQEDAIRFWRSMEFTFVLLMLNKAQELPQIVLVLQMVGSSSHGDSFGAINADLHAQDRDEMGTIDRLTSLLFDIPGAPDGEDSYDTHELSQLRIEILTCLGAICQNIHGSVALARHRSAIGRLIRFLDLQITSLYSVFPIQLDSDQQEDTVPLHRLITTSINLTTRLLYQLLHNHSELIDLRQKLAVIHGGHHKFLVAFTRLAFSEQLALEAGIDDEVVDAAHEILDAVLSPEEGEAIVKAVETPRGSTSRTVSMPLASAPE